ncbi:MAG: VOC family protein [Proteobacteria bacterium]|nr:VOC family protein [Pseudomonadota bacterium]
MPARAPPAPDRPGSSVARLAHIAIWTHDLERLTAFYARYFGARVGANYANAAKGFESRFLDFDGGARLEIMRTTRLALVSAPPGAQRAGLTHLALSVGSPQRVDEVTGRLAADGYPILDGPRRTGDGYYECVVLDPDGTRLEITD